MALKGGLSVSRAEMRIVPHPGVLHRWQETFEDVYTASNLQGPKFKWYITAGVRPSVLGVWLCVSCQFSLQLSLPPSVCVFVCVRLGV